MGAPSGETRRRREGDAKVEQKVSLAPAKQGNGLRLGSIDEVPENSKVEFVLSGYRLGHSNLDAIRSIFTWHSDTLNIWTHLLGLLYYVANVWRCYYELASTPSSTLDYASFAVYLCCGMLQMGASTVYHTLRCVSGDHEDYYLRIDVLGVAAMILGSHHIGLAQGFPCSMTTHVAYMLGLVAILSVSVYLLAQPHFQQPEGHLVRNLVLCCAVSYGLAPCLHWLFECNFHCAHSVVWGMLGMFGFYFLGFAVFFSMRIPERWAPGAWNFGASHMWWHVCVWLAGASWLEGMIRHHHWRATHGLPCDGVDLIGDS